MIYQIKLELERRSVADQKLLYQQIIDYLKEKMQSGEMKPNMKLPTEMELAERFNVSRITSKRALEELSKEGLIYRIQGSGSFVAEKEYSDMPARQAAPYVQGQQKIISMVLPFKASMGKLVDAIRGATDFLHTKGYYLGVHNTSRDLYQEKLTLTRLVKDGVQGIIYYPLSDSKNLEVMNALCMENYPVVSIDKYFDSLPVDSVVSDNLSGGYQVASHLARLGHQRIAFVSDAHIEGATSIRDRYFGYCKALKDHNLSIDHDIIKIGFFDILKQQDPKLMAAARNGDYTIDRKHIMDIVTNLRRHNVTAIQAINDDIGTYFEKVCLEMGLHIPEDIAITGFDNIELSEHVDVPLTTVAQDFYEIGRRAAEIVVERIEGGRKECVKEVVPVKLIERESSSVPVKAEAITV